MLLSKYIKYVNLVNKSNKYTTYTSSNKVFLQSFIKTVRLEHSVKFLGNFNHNEGPIKLSELTQMLDFKLNSCLCRVL